MEDLVKTDLYCHECNKNFIAQLDMALDGNHIIECPYCGHEHCRVIKDGLVTGDRYDSHNGSRIPVERRRTWKASDNVLLCQTNTVSSFLREKWLNFGV